MRTWSSALCRPPARRTSALCTVTSPASHRHPWAQGVQALGIAAHGGCACGGQKNVFASESVVRADCAGLPTAEIPLRVMEKRPPSINFMKRVPNVLKRMAKLTYAIRVKG